jgi:YHS domain-containing protein
MAMDCPVCGAKAHIRTSRSMSTITREQYYHCTNPACSHVFVAVVSIIRTVGESLLKQTVATGPPVPVD